MYDALAINAFLKCVILGPKHFLIRFVDIVEFELVELSTRMGNGYYIILECWPIKLVQ